MCGSSLVNLFFPEKSLLENTGRDATVIREAEDQNAYSFLQARGMMYSATSPTSCSQSFVILLPPEATNVSNSCAFFFFFSLISWKNQPVLCFTTASLGFYLCES